MRLLTNTTSPALWQDVIKKAEDRCSVTLQKELEAYLISLLIRYTNKPEFVQQRVAAVLLDAISSYKHKQTNLQSVGDQCLIFAGLFPQIAEKRLVKISYFVDLGQGAYATISQCTNDLYDLLALQFVVLMDVLQSIRPDHDLLPLDAYEQWNAVGSQRALRILQEYTKGIPIKNGKK